MTLETLQRDLISSLLQLGAVWTIAVVYIFIFKLWCLKWRPESHDGEEESFELEGEEGDWVIETRRYYGTELESLVLARRRE